MAAMSHSEALSRRTIWRLLEVAMKRTLAIILPALAAAALFGGLVQAVLVAAHVSEPAATTVYGLPPRRLWATTVAVLALVGVVIGGLALARPASPFGTACGRLGAIVPRVAGLIAVVNGGLVLAIANGGRQRQRSSRWRRGPGVGADCHGWLWPAAASRQGRAHEAHERNVESGREGNPVADRLRRRFEALGELLWSAAGANHLDQPILELSGYGLCDLGIVK